MNMSLRTERTFHDVDDAAAYMSKTKPLKADETKMLTRRARLILSGLEIMRPLDLPRLHALCGPWLRVHLSVRDSQFGDSELRRLDVGLAQLGLDKDNKKQAVFIQNLIEVATEAEVARRQADATAKAEAEARAAAIKAGDTPTRSKNKFAFKRTEPLPEVLPPLPVGDQAFDLLAASLGNARERDKLLFALKKLLHHSKNNQPGLANYMIGKVEGIHSLFHLQELFQKDLDRWTPLHVWIILVYVGIQPENFVVWWGALQAKQT